MKTRVFQFFFWLIILISIGLRLYKLGMIPVALYWDETAILVDAKTIAQTGLDMHGRPWFQVIFPSYGDFKLPVYIWLAALCIKIFGVSEWVLRLPSAFFGLVTVIIGGLLAKELALIVFKKVKNSDFLISGSQLSTMLILAISPWSLMFSRTGFEGHVGQGLLAISAWMMRKSQKQKWWLLGATIIGSISTYSYFSVRFVWPALIITHYLIFILWSAFSKKNWLVQVKTCCLYVVLPILLYFLLLTPMMRSPLYQDMNNFRLSTTSILNAYDYPVLSNQLREQAGNKFIDRIIFHRHWLMIRELAKNYQDNLSLNFLFLTGDPNLRHGTGHYGLFVLPLVVSLIIGLYTIFRYHQPLGWWLIIWWIVALLPASVPENTPHALRSLNALVPLAIIMGIGLSYFFITIKKWWIIFIYSSWLVLASLSFIYFYFTQYPIDSADAWLDGYKEVALISTQLHNEVDETYINGDDKLYLWLMAYGPYTGSQIQSWPSQGYQYSQFDQVQFKQFSFTTQDRITKKYLVIGPYDQIKQNLADFKLQPTWEKIVIAADGKQKYLAIKLQP